MRHVLPVSLVLSVLGCTSKRAEFPEEAKPPIALNGQTAFDMRQRSTIPIPGSDDKILIAINDITRGQVMTSVSWTEGKSILRPRSMRENDTAMFTVNSHAYKITLKRLVNVLIGEDTARFQISPATVEFGKILSEDEKIQKLISSLSELEDATFVRNGQPYGVEEAITHMQKKWEWKKAEIKTAEDFIRIVASRSSVTGEPYIIKLPDGTEIKSEDWFRKQLAIIEKLPNKSMDSDKKQPRFGYFLRVMLSVI